MSSRKELEQHCNDILTKLDSDGEIDIDGLVYIIFVHVGVCFKNVNQVEIFTTQIYYYLHDRINKSTKAEKDIFDKRLKAIIKQAHDLRVTIRPTSPLYNELLKMEAKPLEYVKELPDHIPVHTHDKDDTAKRLVILVNDRLKNIKAKGFSEGHTCLTKIKKLLTALDSF